MPIVMNHAESLLERSVVSEGSNSFSTIGIPMPTARPPMLAMNMRTEVRIAHRQSHVCDVGIEQRAGESVPEAEQREACQRDAPQQQVGAVFAPAGVVLVDERSHQRIPYHVHDADYEEHDGGHFGREAVDVGVEEQQVHADGLVDQILGQVARAESDSLQPREFVESLGGILPCDNGSLHFDCIIHCVF